MHYLGSFCTGLAALLLGACGGEIVDAGTGGAGGSTATTTSPPSTTGSTTSSGITTASGSSSSSTTSSGASSSTSSTGGSVDHCAGALHLALGATVTGSTCGGAQVGGSPCQEPGHPDVFVYVDAPPGASLKLTASPGVSLLAFPTCQSDQTSQCTFMAPTFEPSVSALLFGVERVDTFCGDFTVGVTQL